MAVSVGFCILEYHGALTTGDECLRALLLLFLNGLSLEHIENLIHSILVHIILELTICQYNSFFRQTPLEIDCKRCIAQCTVSS